MKDHVMNLNYTKTFNRIALLFIILAVVTAVAIPLSLSRQISDAAALKQQYALAEQTAADGTDNADNADGSERGEGHDRDREHAWKSQIAPLNAVNYAIIGGLGVLWAVLALYYWLAVVAWLYKSAVNEGMNKSLWPILGLFLNLFAVMAFCIVRDRPTKA